MIKILKTLKTEMNTLLGDSYCYDEWNKKVKLPYYVGELSESPENDEDGKSQYSFTLTGMDAKTYTKLLTASDNIKNRYKYGKKIILDDGSSVVISYDNTLPISTDIEDLKRIQINLSIMLWENN